MLSTTQNCELGYPRFTSPDAASSVETSSTSETARDISKNEGFGSREGRVVEIEAAWKKTSYLDDLVLHPPLGYAFRYPAYNRPIDRLLAVASSRNLSYRVQSTLANIVPPQLVLSRVRSAKRSSNLTYSVVHIRTNGPYVLDMLTELPEILTLSPRQFPRFRNYLKRQLLSNDCRRVICWVNAGRDALIQAFGPEVRDKISTVYWGKPPRRFESKHRRGVTKLLFVNSANINAPFHFYEKGGAIVVAAFLKLKKRHEGLSLTIRSALPGHLERQLALIDGIKIISRPIAWEEMTEEWASSDIFVMPSHINTAANAYLDAMSYGLPIVTTDIWGNSEIVQEGKTGLLVEHPDAHVFLNGNLFVDSPRFRRIINDKNPELVNKVALAIEALIDNESLRKEMGKRALEQIENGRFSLAERNSRLRSALDKAYGQ